MVENGNFSQGFNHWSWLVRDASAEFEITADQSRWGVEIPGKVKAWAEALSGRQAPLANLQG